MSIAHAASDATITDPRLLAEVRRLIATHLAGYVRSGYGAIEHACLEPDCSCGFDVCGPFRAGPVRCTAFEACVLPAYPELERAYVAHLQGERYAFTVQRCAHLQCRKRVRDTETVFCAWHAEVREREARRAIRKGRPRTPGAVTGALDNQGLASLEPALPES